jgi:trehalose/maltose hydrolase-like predicted phosphorylase
MKKYAITKENPIYQPAYLSNGFVGLRIKTNPFLGQSALLSGFTGSHERFGVEAYAPVPAAECNISMDSASMRNMPQGYELIEQTYDFSCGELSTKFAYTNALGKKLTGTTLVYCSRTLPSVVIQQTELFADQPCELRFSMLFDPTKLPVNTKKTYMPKDSCDGVLWIGSRDGSQTAGVAAYLQALAGDGEKYTDSSDEWGFGEERIFKSYTIRAKPGIPYRFNMITSYVPGALHSEPHWQSVRMVKLAQWRGFERIRDENKTAWASIWESRIKIEGACEEWQDIVDASFFYLYTSLHASAPQSVAPYGLSRRDEYKGHVFWDAESFMFMLPLMTNPDIAKAMLDYRFERLPAARHNAMINGFAGIQFPWQSGESGDEVTRVSAGAAGGAGEQHINFDVAMAFAAYAQVSGDPVFLREKAWPVLKGVAEWIASRAQKTRRGYEILFVTGIDENADNVNNDAFTNIMSKRVLTFANKFAQKLGYPVNALWDDIANNIIIPVHSEMQFIQQYENCPVKDSMPPDTLMAYFPYGYRHSREIDENTYRFYMRDFLSFLTYPMLSGFLGVIPARLGDRKFSLECFNRGNLDFFIDPYMMCTESAFAAKKNTPADYMFTIFLSGRGSLLTGIMLGLTGLDIWQDDPKHWLTGPIALPEGWDRIILEKVFIKGKPARIIAENGKPTAEIQLL